MKHDLRTMLDVAIDAAQEAGKITLAYFQSANYSVEEKDDHSPVTIADRKAEERIVRIIRRYYPEHAILGEEHGAHQGTVPVRWIIDPIDGTRSFISGVPLYGVMIGVEIEGKAELGVVNFPALGDIHYAARGLGSYWNGREAKVSNVESLSSARLLLTDPKKFTDSFDLTAGYRRVFERVKLVRGWGDCYGHMLVATGRAEIMLDPKMSIWDSAALQPIVEEAGGVFSDWKGNRTIASGNAISVNAHLYDQVLSLLRN